MMNDTIGKFGYPATLVREKQMKEWQRKWKLRVIEEFNPGWNDLFESLL